MINFIPRTCPSVALLYGKRPLQRIAVGAAKQQLEIPLDVVADIPGKVDSSVAYSLQIAAPLGRLWHFAALQPGALVGLLRLRGFYEVAPMGLTKVSGARKGRPAVDVDLAASSILAVASQLTILEFRCQGFGSWPSVSVWPRTPALRRLSVREMPLSIWDLPNLFAAHDLETLELQACPLTESQMGIVHSGANVKPEVVILVGCGGKMALTVLLSLGLTRLCYLRVDSPTDAKLKEELTKACRPNIGGIDEEVDVAAVLQAQAERELRAELQRVRRQSGADSLLASFQSRRPSAVFPVMEKYCTSAGRNRFVPRAAEVGPLFQQVRFGPLTGRPGRREHHKFGAADRKATYYYRFHKLIGKANWRKYIERYVAPRSIENRQRWIPTPWPTYQQGKHARSWNWRLPKGLAAATTGDDVLEVWIKFRHKLPKKTFHYFKLLKSGHGHLRRLGTVAAEVGANADASLRCGPLDMPENAQCKEVVEWAAGGGKWDTKADNWIAYPTKHQFDQIFEGVYQGAGLSHKPWFSVLGNHDWGGFKFDNAWDQQMSYTWASDRWVLPAPYYKTSVVYADLGFDVDYYFLDSNFVDAKPPEEDPNHNMCSRKNNKPSATCGAADGPTSVDSCPGWFAALWEEQNLGVKSRR
eukprot:g26438.t1